MFEFKDIEHFPVISADTRVEEDGDTVYRIFYSVPQDKQLQNTAYLYQIVLVKQENPYWGHSSVIPFTAKEAIEFVFPRVKKERAFWEKICTYLDVQEGYTPQQIARRKRERMMEFLATQEDRDIDKTIKMLDSLSQTIRSKD